MSPAESLGSAVRLASAWQHPLRVELPTGHHLRPVRPSDVDLHLPAVLGSRECRETPAGRTWRRASTSTSLDQDRAHLEGCEADMQQRRSFTYVLFDLGETELLGGVRIAPSATGLGGADVSWWVAEWLVGGPIEATLERFVPAWITRDWPAAAPKCPTGVRASVRGHHGGTPTR